MTGKDRPVQYELMFGREASAAIRSFPVGYLPIGCLERHGDHLPMGLDVIKAHKICRLAARQIGGVVFPPHFYSGIHEMSSQEIAIYTGEWGNIYTDRSAEDHLTDIINQIAKSGLEVLVLYSGHYPKCQADMMLRIRQDFEARGSITIIPFWEAMLVQGDHAGISETSLMLYLDEGLVDMSRISAANYQDHGWSEDNTPEKATPEKGEADVKRVIEHLRGEIERAIGR